MTRVTWSLLLLCAALGASGCKNEGTITAQVSSEFPKGFVVVKTTVLQGSNEGEFNENCQRVELVCQIVVTGTTPDGKTETKSVSAKLEAKGVRGGRYKLNCEDPLIVQFPSDAHTFVAHYVGPNGISGTLPTMAGLSSIELLPGQLLTAEPGTQLVVISYPEGLPGGTYDQVLEFDLGWSRDIQVKPLITGKLSCDHQTYLPPFAMNTTDMAAIPAITIPVSDTPVEIPLPLDLLDDLVVHTIECNPDADAAFAAPGRPSAISHR